MELIVYFIYGLSCSIYGAWITYENCCRKPGRVSKQELERLRINAEEDYLKVPLSVLKYITMLEKSLNINK